MELSFPHQMYINGKFVDSESGRTIPTINPANEKVICLIPKVLNLGNHCGTETL